MAPAVLETEILRAPPLDDLKVVLARARPFVGVVQQRRKEPIGGAAVKVRSMRVPVIEGAGTTIVDIPWRIISETPLEQVLQTVTDKKGQFRFEYAPARSEMQVVVTASGMQQQMQYVFNGPKAGLTDRGSKREQPFCKAWSIRQRSSTLAAPRAREQGREVTADKDDVIRSD